MALIDTIRGDLEPRVFDAWDPASGRLQSHLPPLWEPSGQHLRVIRGLRSSGRWKRIHLRIAQGTRGGYLGVIPGRTAHMFGIINTKTMK